MIQPGLETAASYISQAKQDILGLGVKKRGRFKVALRFSGVNFVSLNFIDYVSMTPCMGDNRVGDTSDLLDLPQEVGLGRRGSF